MKNHAASLKKINQSLHVFHLVFSKKVLPSSGSFPKVWQQLELHCSQNGKPVTHVSARKWTVLAVPATLVLGNKIGANKKLE